MEQIKQKKIRKLLISYTNEQIKYSKKVKKFNILINSTPLEELEKKNMKSKEFFIQEKTETYQNIDNRRSIIQNICINNNYFYSNVIIYPLSQRCIYNNIIKDMINININECTLNTTTIYDENSSDNKLSQTLRQKTKKNIINNKMNNQESPLDHSSLVKKELGERKLKLHKKEINFCSSYNNNSLFFQREKDFNEEKKDNDNNNNEKGNEADKDFDFFISERLSSITLATEVSRIIKVCHNDDNISTSKISKKKEEREDIKKAKQYAKKLKLYCRTLKNKFSNSSKIKKIPNKIKPLNINGIKFKNKEKDKMFPITDRNMDRDEYLKKDKIKKHHKSKKLNIILGKSYEKLKKKQSEKLKDNNLLSDNEFVDNYYESHRIVQPNKKMKSERNIKIKINDCNYINYEENNNDCNNLTEQSTCTNNKFNSSKKKNVIKISKKAVRKKYKEEENKSKFITQIESKSPLKKKKKDLILNYVKKIKNKIIDNFHQDNNISKKDSKKRPKLILRNNDDINKAIESPSLFKKTKKKRGSIKVKMNEKSMIEQIFFKKKNLSTTGQNSLIKKLKKQHLNENTEQDNNKNYKKNNKKIKVELIENEEVAKNKGENEEGQRIIRLKKTKTQKSKKQRNTYMFSENNFNPNKINLKKKRKMSSVDKEEEIVNNTINYLNKKNKKIIFSLKDDNKKIEEDKYNTIDIDDFNKMDDYLYKKKHKKVKIGPK